MGLFNLTRVVAVFRLAIFLLVVGSCQLPHQNVTDEALDHNLRVVSWNVLYGFNHHESADEGAQWIAGQAPDVLALQELNGLTHEGLEHAAGAWGHSYAALQKEGGFALGLTSTAPIEVLERRVEGFHHGFLHAKTHGIHFFVVHFWPGKEHEVAEVVGLAQAQVAQGARVIVLGDFNSNSERDAEFLDQQGIDANYAAVAGAEQAGFVDVVHRHDPGALYSCPSPITIPRWSEDLAEVESKRQRIDFLFADEVLAERADSATIVCSERIEQVSDHYPIVADFHMASTDAPDEASLGQREFSFGVVADCQYCAAESKGKRLYSQSEAKLTVCVGHLNTLDLACVLHLGDLIDRDFASFEVVLPIFAELTCPKHQVLGNHDYDVADELKRSVPERMGMPANYYDFAVEGWRFVVLDGNDISCYAHPPESAEHEAAVAYQAEHAVGKPLWNGAMGPQQLAWLEEVLHRSDEAAERVILFSHFPVFPDDVHNLWNAAEVLGTIDRHSCVKAYINGHNHAGNYCVRNGVHYLTLKGMVDTMDTSYAVIDVLPEHLRVIGIGRETDRLLSIR